uniref:Zinc finger matrin-type 4 n=1 Tax=Meleagris gallopavo TaxID=9103 RepID=A0A803XTV7_MELGA
MLLGFCIVWALPEGTRVSCWSGDEPIPLLSSAYCSGKLPMVSGAGAGGRLPRPAQPCRARRSQSLLLGVELELQQMKPSAFPAQLVWETERSVLGRGEPGLRLRRAPIPAAPQERPFPSAHRRREEPETRQQSSPLLHASPHRWRLSSQKTPLRKQTLGSLKQPRVDRPPAASPPQPRRDSDRYCQLCAAWFNNPVMAQQHYDGKKHKKNAARAELLEQLGKTLDLGELRGLKRSYTCNICNVTLNSIEQYHAHLKGSKHQTNLKNQ